MRTERRDVVIVGSGFAGSILARILALRGRDVVLVERGSHPRFALGESSTPLAGLSLERLADRYGLEDLDHLAAYGRWSQRLPQLRRGLKRGFTFYRHEAGRPYRNGPDNDRRLLVAASPDDWVADCHWLRSDVDAFLVEKAVAAGVDYRSRTRLDVLRPGTASVTVAGLGPAGPVEIEARFLVDASGARGFLADAVPIPRLCGTGTPTRLIFGHFDGVDDFAAAARRDGAVLDPGPYPDERAAVHHLLEEGWLYLLPFDHGVVSAGLLSRGAGPPLPPEPGAAWQAVLERYPSLASSFAGARSLRPVAGAESIAYQRRAAVGERWLLLPHAYAFFDPLFSTGMAWSLVAVERVAQMLGREGGGVPGRGELGRYAALLAQESAQVSDLVEGAYRCLGDFRRFAALAALYFAAASFQELSQRLLDPPAQGWAWEGLLGATDPLSRAFVVEGRRHLETAPGPAEAFESWVRAAIGPRNAAGLCDPRRRNLYPVDLEVLLSRSPLLGMTRRELEGRLPRLRGSPRGIFQGLP